MLGIGRSWTKQSGNTHMQSPYLIQIAQKSVVDYICINIGECCSSGSDHMHDHISCLYWQWLHTMVHALWFSSGGVISLGASCWCNGAGHAEIDLCGNLMILMKAQFSLECIFNGMKLISADEVWYPVNERVWACGSIRWVRRGSWNNNGLGDHWF